MAKLITKHRRGTTKEWEESTIILEDGEVVIEECTDGLSRMKIGDGIHTFKELPYPDKKLREAIDLANARIDTIVNIEEVANTDPIYELTDIRIAKDGYIYDCAGAHVRAIEEDCDDLRSSLQQFINAEAVDGLLYENNLLYLTAGGRIVSEPVYITGGGGGGGSSTTIRVTNNNGTSAISVAKGSPVVLKFTFTSIEDGIETGDGTCTIQVDDVTRKTYSIKQGENSVDVSDYLRSGTNSVRITCADTYGNTRSLVYTVTVIELSITSTFDSATVYDKEISFKYIPYGLIEKDVHFVLDGKEIALIKGISYSGRQQTQTIPAMTHGVHTLDVYMTTEMNDTVVESNHLIYEVMFTTGRDEPLLSSVFSITEATQGDLLSIPYVVYDPNSLTADIELKITYMVNGEEVEYSKTTLTVDRKQQYWNTRLYPIGKVKFTITYNSGWSNQLNQYLYTVSKNHSVSVEAAMIDVEAETNDLELYLTAQGRSNNEADPAHWENNGITTTFNNFNWRANGWVTDRNGDTCLRLTGDATAEINLPLFEKDFRREGKTIEFEFAVRDVNKRDSIIIDCYSGNVGLRATADTAFLQSTMSKVSCNYKEEEKLRIGFTVQSLNNDTHFICTYLDGVLSGIAEYAPEGDIFEQTKPVTIKLGSPYCGLDLYTVRVYTTALDAQQMINNYIADLTDPALKLELFTKNSIYDEFNELSYSKVKSQIPTITFIGKMPTYKGDKKKNSVRMIFEHPTKPELNFDEILNQIDVQGTSSAGYVRKNWKTKHNEKHTHMEGELPAKIFCLKVDYAEATGTHNTQNANLVETFYTEAIPPKKNIPSSYTEDQKKELGMVRTTITGFPVVIFHLDTDDTNIINNITKEELAIRSDVMFSSKANFNFDKDAEDVFAFNTNYDTECWEFTQNTDENSFLTPWPSNHSDFWEARYHPRLGELEELEESGNTTAASKLQDEMISRFKDLYDWVHSTARGGYTDGNGQYHQLVTNEPLPEPYIDRFGQQYTIDNDEYRLAKFATEFEDHFNLHYATVYYVYTFFGLMVDQRAKNMFLTYWHDNAYNNETPGRWYPYFYDNDTSFGINNTGHLTFDYYHEDNDTIGTADVYNGQYSVLWTNFRDAFATEIQNMYAYLRNNNKLTYDKIIGQFVDKGSSQWSASIYNQDADYKYISIATDASNWDSNGDGIPDKTSAYLYQVRGNGEHHLKYFVQNRIKYCDSKWKCANYLTDRCTVRIYTPSKTELTGTETEEERKRIEALNRTLEVVPPSADITITPFSNMYCGVSYGAASGDDETKYIQQVRATKDIPVTFSAGSSNVNDKETYIYGASEISSLGDLSTLYCKLLDVGSATKLVDLKIGNRTEGYMNTNLETVTVGSNKLLKSIDVSNCPNLTDALDVSQCSNIEEIYAEGSGISGVNLPDSGYVRIVKLPDTISTLTIKNQRYIQELTCTDYTTIKTLSIENCNIDTVAFLEKCKDEAGEFTVERVHLTDIEWSIDNVDFIRSLYVLKGLDENGATCDDAFLSGTCHIKKLTGAEYGEINSHYPNLKITFDELESQLIFKDAYGIEIPGTRQTIHNGGNGRDPITAGMCETPIKAQTAQYTYKYAGWSRYQEDIEGGTPQPDALLEILADRTLYPVFDRTVRSYPVNFYNNNVLLQTVVTEYGSTAKYTGDIPKKQNTASPDSYAFSGWDPSPANIKGPTNCYAQFYFDDSSWYNVGLLDIDYTLNELARTLQITKYKSNEVIVKIPQTYNVATKDYTVDTIGGFKQTDIEMVTLPDTVEEFSEQAFNECFKLSSLTIPEGTKVINNMAFANLLGLEEVNYNATDATVNRTIITASPFENSAPEDGFMLTIGKNVKSIPDYLFYQYNVLIDARCVNTLKFESPSSCTYIGSGAFRNCVIKNMTLPEGIKTIGSNAFFSNRDIEELVLPEGLESVGASAFQDWTLLKRISIPSTATNLEATLFARCPMIESITIAPDNSTYEVKNNCLIHSRNRELIAGCKNSVIPQDGSVTSIAKSAFSYAAGLPSVTIPSGVPAIEEKTFEGCKSLTNVIIPSTVTKVGAQAFFECYELKDMALPDTVELIESYAYSTCNALKNVKLPANLKSLGEGAFRHCEGLQSITFNSKLTKINELAFDDCKNLKEINVPFAEGVIEGAPWGADITKTKINYNYKGD